MMEFSEKAKSFINKNFSDIKEDGSGILDMSLAELKTLRERIVEKRQEYALIENSFKVCANAAYGSCGNEHFYWYRPEVAESITGECRTLTTSFWTGIEKFLKEDIWSRKDLWEKFNFELDESKHDWMRQQSISVQADTDSVYSSYGPLFRCMTTKYKKLYNTDEAKVKWILDFYKRFMDGWQNEQCENMYNSRHAHNVHEFELELICKAVIGLAKKKYVKSVAFEKGHFMIDNPKLKSTGVEIVKSTTPAICRKFMKELVDDLLYKYDDEHKEEFIFTLNNKLRGFYQQFHAANIDDISQSVGIGDYKKYVIDDKETLKLAPRCPFSVKAAARYNHLAYKNGRSDLNMMSGKIKYYNIRVGRETDYFGFPYGECPDFAPPVDWTTQWTKNLIDPINRFLTAMSIPEIGPTNCIQTTLFGF